MDWLLIPLNLFPPVTASAGGYGGELHVFILQLGVIMIAARIGGGFFHRVLNMPSVLGELCIGILIGPFALGAVELPVLGALFPLATEGALPVPSNLYALATFASILLLFLAGLETDLKMFLRYSVAGTVIGICGVAFSFVLGDLAAVWFGFAEHFMDPRALFLGAISTATSVGITARILSERRKTDSPEGVTIMAAAVLDDVLGVIIVAVVVGISKASGGPGGVAWDHIAQIAVKAIGFWLICTAGTLLLATRISWVVKLSESRGGIESLCLGLALVLAGLMEMAGLAMIIGAYIMGLSLSRTDLALYLQEKLEGVHDLLVPVFFCVMGMLVNVRDMQGALVFGLVYSAIAIAAKVIGCALPALLLRFNMVGALRIGLGMLPRGEVALIVAGIGISNGIISSELFGVSILMTLITTIMAPPLLLKLFTDQSGVRGSKEVSEGEQHALVTLNFPAPDIAEFVSGRLVRAFREEGFFVNRVHASEDRIEMRKENMVFVLKQDEGDLEFQMPADQEVLGRYVLLEELVGLQDLLESVKSMHDLDSMKTELVGHVFDTDD